MNTLQIWKKYQGIISWCVAIGLERIGNVNNLTLKEYVARIEKIRKSVKRHSNYGRRGYYDFIKHYV
jgi:outer membrane receptor for monomeric catechols